MPDAPLPPLPPVDQPRWRSSADELLRRFRLPSLPPAVQAAAVILAVVIAAALAAIALLLLLQRQAAPADRAPLPTVAPAAPEPPDPVGPPGRDGDRRSEAEEVVVDVAGAVARPGLVTLPPGSRVADALAAAGGPAADAALAGLNQARVLADGEQVRVPRMGEPPPPQQPQPAAPGSTGASPPATPVDLNRATASELDVLPGVGPATAAAIVAWREENGGYRRVDDLLEVPGIGPARLERLRPHVRV